MIKLLKMDFVPGSADVGLLALRAWLGLTLLLNHGWDKLVHFQTKAGSFPDPLGIGSQFSLGLAVYAEVACAALLVLGLFTRFAALCLSIQMTVAFFLVHNAALSGQHTGELAFVYLAGFVALFLSGAGRLSFDGRAR
ncbi:MAG TPA: DoxX family protein [Verrucomicrobiae bacterium]|mgnify:CR=1 FL=1|nr:DoxX family protein [Verrucomicrobiae bacterium]